MGVGVSYERGTPADLVVAGHGGAVPVEIVEANVERDDRDARKVGVPQNLDVRVLSPPENGNSNSHGARPVHLIITMIQWIRTSRLSIQNSLSRHLPPAFLLSLLNLTNLASLSQSICRVRKARQRLRKARQTMWRARALWSRNVDGFVPHNQNVNLRIVGHPERGRARGCTHV